MGPYSPFRETLVRLSGLNPLAATLVVAGQRHADWLAREADAASLDIEVLLEPVAKDSGPAVAAAAAWIARRDPQGVAVIVASDHHIPDNDAFREAVRLAGLAASQNWIVTMGIAPAGPATAYGYIQPGEALAGLEPVRRNDAFVEKPDAATAARYLAAGYLWNSGNFIARADVLLEELDRHEPLIAQAARDAVAAAEASPTGWRLGAAFTTAPKKSFDYAVMERTDRAAVLPASFEWSDLGAWDAVWAVSPKDDAGNVAAEHVMLHDARECLVNVTQDLQVAVVGARRLAIIGDAESLLICDLDASQQVKAVADATNAKTSQPPSLAASLADWSQRYDLWFRASALPLWWAVGGDHRLGGFHELIGLDGAAVGAPKRSRVQTRQTFVFARAAHLEIAGPWLQAAEHGWRFFERCYRRPDGLFRTLVAADGGVLDDTPYLYDQAFALMALAALHEIEPAGGERLAAARSLLQAITAQYRHTGGAYCEAGERRYQANPLMHLLEAALAWCEADGGKIWFDLAQELVDHALAHLIDGDLGLLREFFTADWKPAEGGPGRLVEPGHQFEWAWLLERWADLSGSKAAAQAARVLFQAGLAGWDAKRSVAVDSMDDLVVRNANARLWPQTEMVKAAALLGRGRQGDGIDFDRHAAASAAGLWRYLEAPVAGLWRDKMAADGRFVIEPAPASSFYHLFGAVQALRRFHVG